MSAYDIEFTVHKKNWLTLNKSLHWAERARRTKVLRRLGAWQARALQLPKMERARIIAWIQYPTARRADPHNASPTIKALIDGLIDYGVLPDDNSEHLEGPDPRRAPGKSAKDNYGVRMLVIPLDGEGGDQ